jgi:drug/metabolite transporter (DMT)-like permease
MIKKIYITIGHAIPFIRLPRTVWLGIVYAFIGSFCFALTGLFAKVTDNRFTVSELLFFRSLICIFVIFPFVYKEKNLSIRFNKPWLFAVRCLASLLSMYCMYYSVAYIPLSANTLLINTYPIFVPAVMFFIFKTKTDRNVILGIVVSFIGLIFILRPGGEVFCFAGLVAVISGLLSAIGFSSLRQLLSEYQNNVNKLLFYYFVFCTLAPVPFMFYNWHTPTLFELIMLFSIGISAMGYQFMYSLALKRAPVQIVSPILFFSVIFNTIFGALFWKEIPDIYLYIGSVIIFVGTYLVIHFGNTKKKESQ